MSFIEELALRVTGCVFLTSLTSGVILTSWMCRLSWKWGWLDKPDGLLKCHTRPTATLGGVPLFVAILCGLALMPLLRFPAGDGTAALFQWHRSYSALLAAGVLMLVVGIHDDIRKVMPRTKLLFQMLAAIIVVGSGVLIQRCDFFGVFQIHLGMLTIPFTLFWLIGGCNAFNFIDGMDGLAAGIGVVISLFLALLGLWAGDYVAMVVAVAVAGGLGALLSFNIRPALIFLGDSGSQLVGLILGTLTIRVATTNGAFALPCAGVLLSVPIMDAFLSIIRRYTTSESPAHGDRKHIHHCLRRQGFSVHQVSLTLATAVAITGLLGMVFKYAQGVEVGWASLMLVGLELYLGGRLGCVSLSDLRQKLTGGYRWKMVDHQAAKSSSYLVEVETLWAHMKPLFEQMRLDRAVLTLEGDGEDGRTNREIYRWVRSENLMAELLSSRWTKRFPLDGKRQRFAILQLESTEKLLSDEQRIEALLQKISENMHSARRIKQGPPPLLPGRKVAGETLDSRL